MTGNFLEALQNEDCQRIVFACSTFDPFARLLASKQTDPSLAKSVDKIDPFFQSDIFTPHPKICTGSTKRSEPVEARSSPSTAGLCPSETSYSSRDTMLRAISERRGKTKHSEDSKIARNKNGNRIDLHLEISDILLSEIKRRIPKLCNNYHLRGHCSYGHVCGYKHGNLCDRHKILLREVAREQPCRHGSSCSDPACFAGHRCLRKQNCGDACRFPREMHFKDTHSINGVESQLACTSAVNTKIEALLGEAGCRNIDGRYVDNSPIAVLSADVPEGS